MLQDMVLPLTTESELLNLCRVSANYHEDIAQIVAKAISTVGPQGMIEIEESASGRNMLELVEGIVIDRGFVTEEFLTEKKV